MRKPHIATQVDTASLSQQIRIGTVLIIANIIQGQKPAQSFSQCKLEAIEQLEAAVDSDWQV